MESFWENWTGRFTLLLDLLHRKNKECIVPTCSFGTSNLMLNYLKKINIREMHSAYCAYALAWSLNIKSNEKMWITSVNVRHRDFKR